MPSATRIAYLIVDLPDHASAAEPCRTTTDEPNPPDPTEPRPTPSPTPRVDHDAIWMAILEQVLKIPLFIRDRVPG